jgi:hypothetical protein
VVGLGAGLLPMFLHNHLPIDHIQVVELDGVIGDVAKRQFGFVENDRMQLHVGDGIEAVCSIARLSTCISKNTGGMLSTTTGVLPHDDKPHESTENTQNCSTLQEMASDHSLDRGACQLKDDIASELANDLSGVHCNERTIKTEGKLHILFIDADSQDPRSVEFWTLETHRN